MIVFSSGCQVRLTSVRFDMPAAMTVVSGTFGWLPCTQMLQQHAPPSKRKVEDLQKATSDFIRLIQ